ncbi:MAG: glycosyl transferase [Alphaproteobacteria bacterium]|jgi:glycosyltransferase involved in cell wall biosynthesis|nr:glycosyl transferase [Alphaproteobacteria bacterium]PPR13735.1 MAG: GDP-mannose-dependent alpha-(1-2)-phosphatidylinositol mannosyltransferase [Alphaproteobacteria bacterium MarineAlpha12_Bin1]|tara:strand:- start:3747 stop:5003 length:1257 start_codon:yes stop_codon:yes gene_type:complete
MNILFVHQNFPGQFKHLAPKLASKGHNVIAMPVIVTKEKEWHGVSLWPYQNSRSSSKNIHPWVSDIETKTIRADDCYRAALALRKNGFVPDVIIAHPGWGESLFLKEVWPNSKLGIYCEFFYHTTGADVGNDPEFPSRDDEACRLALKNVNNLLHFEVADAGISPTHWQASTFPERFRKDITIIHDGIDTEIVRPDPTAFLTIDTPEQKNIKLTKKDEIITFVNRNLEPYRGYHIFMRTLPNLLKSRPNARVLIVGGDGVSYGASPESGKTWKGIFRDEVRSQINDSDWGRVHFLGNIEYGKFVALLQVSTVHVYLTYPFVLSWSLLEAMSAGCAIVASNTKPVFEAINHDETGRLVDFFDVDGICREVCSLLDDENTRRRLGNSAREFAINNYDLNSICLPKQVEWVLSLAESGDEL